MKDKNLFLWCDLETSGIEPDGGAVLEVSFALCYPSGKVILEANTPLQLPAGFSIADIWDNHLRSGLVSECRSESAVRRETFDQQFATRLKEVIVKAGNPHVILAGSSIHTDRRWIRDHLPFIEDLLHYRMLDVRSLLLMLGSVGTDVQIHQGQDKSVVHRAKADREWAQAMFGKIQELVTDISKRTRVAEIRGSIKALRAYAWWRNGEQYVGTTGTTLKHAIKEARMGLPEGTEVE